MGPGEVRTSVGGRGGGAVGKGGGEGGLYTCIVCVLGRGGLLYSCIAVVVLSED